MFPLLPPWTPTCKFHSCLVIVSLAAKTGGLPAQALPWTNSDMGVGWVSEQNGGSFRKGDEDRSYDDPGSRLST